jgi:hypothetical protein
MALMKIPQALTAANISSDARVVATREDLIAYFAPIRPKNVAEIGPALSDFSKFMIEKLRPNRFFAFDVVIMHRFPSRGGHPSNEFFGGLTHVEYFEERIASLGGDTEVIVEVGESWDTLVKYPDNTFDLIYLDGAHDYESVRMDAMQAIRLASRDCILIFRGYILYDHLLSTEYGVVQAVNELLLGGAWVVAGFAFEQNMFCDIALRRIRF